MRGPSAQSLRTPPRLLGVATPLFIELCLGIGVGVIGTVLAARLGDASGAAFALANHVLAMLFILFRIVGAGVSVVVAQSLGRGQRQQADAVALATLGAATWIGAFTAFVAWFGATPLLQLLNSPADVMALAAPLLRWLAPALFFDAWNATQASVMRAHLRGADVLRVIAVMHTSHLALAWLLMYGFGPLPPLGLPGFAIALAVSRAMGVAMHLMLWRARLGLRPSLADAWRLRRQELAAVLRIGTPGAAEAIAYRLCFMISLAVVGTLGAPALAAHAYASQVTYGALLAGLATGLAVEIVVGHLIGAGDLHGAHRLVKRALAAGLLSSVVAASAAALAGPWLLVVFTQDPHILTQAAVLLWWTVLLEPGRTFNLVVINALRAAGDARYPVVVGVGSMLVVLAGGSWWLGVHLGLGLVGVWLAYAADEWLRGLLMWRRWARLGWVPHARAVHQRLRRSASGAVED